MKLEFFKDNEIDNYLETYFEIVSMITLHLEGEDLFSVAFRHYDEWGRGGLYVLAEEWTSEFEMKYKDEEWGVSRDWVETIEEFFEMKNKI